ncbi:UDP-N-acetylmuramate--L-alanine ligase [Roseibacillus persicicus]|uniref:UDP-N-acetylmuramate--L-alanine ligase n=1 Tax=Roseibacillus persicicus TaxID=454148 RepID=UPI00280D63D7|nr:UDP-N-acetylmuramate--L-alanine ligase [Roseibacillus persicicus]MDQ8191182.1 UDP-N-acetylmuramate--L-alanine ligase [Roseibacillus persicicus]
MADWTERFLDRDNPARVHLIGVAGSGMSGLAGLLLQMGHKVSGSDRVTSGEVERLKSLGLQFSSPHTAEAVEGVDAVVYSSAIRPCNPARAAAESAGIPCLLRAECLAAILGGKEGVVVSGTHGKTTTSAMCAHVLRKAGEKPSHYVGAEIPVLGTNAHWEESGELMVAEGDESDGTLRLYRPKYSIVLNVEAEHLDFYSGIDEIDAVFTTLLGQTSDSVIYCGDDEGARRVCGGREQAISYGLEEGNDFVASNILEGRGTTAFTVVRRGEELGRVELGIPGRHNVLNALAAIVLACEVEADFDLVARALSTFAGAKRRFETKWRSQQLRVIDDYGHHPTEIEATLKTALSLGRERLVVVFQPHRFSRTQRLAEEFGKALQLADLVYVLPVYAASEDPIEGVTGATIVEAMDRQGPTQGYYLPNFDTAHHVVGNALKERDLLLTLGAGNVHEVGRKIIRDIAYVEELKRDAGEEGLKVKLYEPMKRHTTMLVGGPAQFWVEPETFDGFVNVIDYFKEEGFPVRVVGRGSNLLVRDGGIRGAVIHPSNKGEFGALSVVGEGLIEAGAGVRFKKLASFAQKQGIGDFEWMEGIPGNVGGGLRMNAGAMGTETFDQVVELEFLDEDGQRRVRKRNEIEAHYRNVPELRRNYALRVIFKGEPKAEADKIQEQLDLSRDKRKSSQPRGASAGCIFKNPQSAGIGAGQLVDELGLKGSTVGKAIVSHEHGNFIVNGGKGSATEVLELINQIQAKAKEERGIELDTEVQILGEDEATF